MTPKRRQPMGQTIGGVLFGFEQQVWRNQPPPHELVHHARPDDPVPAGDGGLMTLEMPDPLPRPDATGVTGSELDEPGPREPELRELVPSPAIAVRVRQPMAMVDLGALVDAHVPGLAARVPSLGLAVAGPPYIRYHDWGDEIADVELGFPVTGDAAAVLPDLASCADGEAGTVTLPGGPCAVMVHVGPYQGLAATWGRLDTWVCGEGLEPAGPPWESYVDNPAVLVAEALHTLVIRPVRR